MIDLPEYIVAPWEGEVYAQSLQISDLEDVGTKQWCEFHKRLMLLNQQSVLEISSMREESVKEWLVTFGKISVLIYEAIQIQVWKQKVFPLLIELNGEPTNTFALYSVFYHEGVVTSLLESVLFHVDSAQTIGDSTLDLVDYAVGNVTALLYDSKEDRDPSFREDAKSCLVELLEKKKELEFDIGIKCVSILRYLAEFADNLPLSVLSRMLTTHDVPYLLTELIEKQPWRKRDAQGEVLVYSGGKWEKVNDEEKLCRAEGQVWIGLRELLLNPNCAPYYEITEFRVSQLSKLQKYLREHVIDQISPLIELRRWLCQLNIQCPPSNIRKPIVIEIVPQIRQAIIKKHHKKWKKLARQQSKSLFNKDMQTIKDTAQILSEAYDLDKLEFTELKRCSFCKDVATKRCSQCKEVWYCARSCQVKDWPNHKELCAKIVKSKAK